MRSRQLLAGILACALMAAVAACDSGQSGPTAPSSSRDLIGGSGSLLPAVADPGLPQDEVSLKMTAPAPISPGDGATVTDPNRVLSIANPQAMFVSTVAARLRVEIWTNPPGSAPVLGEVVSMSGSTTDYTIPNNVLSDETVYVWRSRAEFDGAVGPWSDVYQFITQFVKIDPPTLLDPINNKLVSSFRPVFTVINPVVTGDAGTVLIEVEVSLDTGFGSPVELARVAARARGETNVPIQKTLQPETTYYWRARGTNRNLPVTAVLEGAPIGSEVATVTKIDSDWTAPENFRTPETAAAPSGPSPPSLPPGGRTPNPPPGQKLPAPSHLGTVQALASQRPDLLANSCQEHGGTWEFMDLIVDTLRTFDTRWGYGCKLGNCNTPLLDVVAYNWGSQPDEGTNEVYTIDVIVGHCGSNPQPGWTNTQPDGGPGLSRWTGRGRF